MFFPMFIAILLGLVNPSNTTNPCSSNSGTVVSNSVDGYAGDDGETDPVTGENGQIKPPKP